MTDFKKSLLNFIVLQSSIFLALPSNFFVKKGKYLCTPSILFWRWPPQPNYLIIKPDSKERVLSKYTFKKKWFFKEMTNYHLTACFLLV